MTNSSISDISFEQALSERYLAYALSTITSRSLPDVRDGLKPVHRRLIYAMQQLHLNPEARFKKSARVVGDVMGKFHPHGDQAIYDALVRLAQQFSVRYPLIDGQGNFGNIDGDNAAAMRYTEARLTEVAALLMDGIDENTVDLRPTYDGESEEPVVFPAAFPNLLANGSTGIAVGMATSIPPHNVAELCQGLYLLIDKPDVTIQKLTEVISGPDFPTGGVLVESKESVLKGYDTGRGSFRLRCRWEKEDLKGDTYRIIVTEIPYQVGKSRLIAKIADMLSEKILPLLANIVDESTDEVRIILEPKNPTVEAAVLMESLFRLTDMEVRIPLNMNVLVDGKTPKVLSLKEILQAFLNHRLEVLVRRTIYRLEHIKTRLEILAGYLIAYLNIDEVIRIIREEDEPKPIMVACLGLTENQAEAVLNMRLRTLRKLQEIEIRQEHAMLAGEEVELSGLLESSDRQKKRIKGDIRSIEKKFSLSTPLGARRTTILEAEPGIIIPVKATVEPEDVTVICSKMGWIRTVKGHQVLPDELRYKDGDKSHYVLPAQTTDKLVVFATNGRFYTLSVDKLPRGRGHGEPLRFLIDLAAAHTVIEMTVFPADDNHSSPMHLLASTKGHGFMIHIRDALSQTRMGRQVMLLDEGTKAKFCLAVTGDMIAIVSNNRKMVIFPVAEVPVQTKGRGVTLQNFRRGGLQHSLQEGLQSEVSDIKIFTEKEGLTWSRNGKPGKETNLGPWRVPRGAVGRLAPTGFPRNNTFRD